MLVKNINDRDVINTTYVAHGGGMARMVLTSPLLKSMEFFAFAVLPSGNELEAHRDPVEEIYFMLHGGGLMKIGNEERAVQEGDAIWIPAGDVHSLKNTGEETISLIVVAAYPVR